MTVTIQDQLTDQALIHSLASKLCPSCGRSKKRRQTLCGREYFALPKDAREALYRPLGHGYREAVAVALDLLGAAEFRLPPTDV